MTKVLVSACLLGEKCRYDGAHKKAPELMRALAAEKVTAIPFCPEEAGGLGTPRPPCVLVGGDGEDVLGGEARVLDDEGGDRTEAYVAGARLALERAAAEGCLSAYLKESSPSCGCAVVATNRGRIPGRGVTAALLRRSGIATISVS